MFQGEIEKEEGGDLLLSTTEVLHFKKRNFKNPSGELLVSQGGFREKIYFPMVFFCGGNKRKKRELIEK